MEAIQRTANLFWMCDVMLVNTGEQERSPAWAEPRQTERVLDTGVGRWETR